MSGWEFDKKSGSGSDTDKVKWTKLPEGITRIRLLDDSPNIRWTHWVNKFQRSVNCPGKGCPICEIRKQEKANKLPNTYAVGQRFAINVWNYETKSVELLEQGKTFFTDLRDLIMDLQSEGIDATGAVFKVRRRGTGKDDTSYRIDIDNKSAMEDEVKAKLSQRTNLDDYFKPHTVDQIKEVVVAKPNGKDDANKIWGTIMQGEETTTTSTVQEDEEVELQ